MEVSENPERPAPEPRTSEHAQPRRSLPTAIKDWISAKWIRSSVVAYIIVFLMVFQPNEIFEAFEQGKASTQQAAVLAAAGLPVFVLLAWLYDRYLARKPILDIKVASTGVGTVLVVGVLVVAAFAGINRIRVSDEAITAFEIGREYDRRPDISEYNLRLAERQYARATEAAPNFALAFAYLSKLHMRLYFLGYDDTSARLEMARAAMDHARELDRDLPQISLAEGYYHYWGFAQYDQAERAFQDARRGGLRKDADVFAGMGYVQRRKGQWRNALKNLRKAAELDARNADRLAEVGHTYSALRCYPEAERAYSRSIALAPDAHSTEIALAEAHLRSTGRTDMMGRVAAGLPMNVDPDGEFLVFKVKASLYAGDSLRALGALLQSGRSVIARQSFIHTNPMLRGIVRTYMGNREGAAASLDSARAGLSAMLHGDPNNRRLHLALSQTYAALGVRDSAIAHGERAIRLLRQTRGDDALDLPDYQLNLAAVYTWVGEPRKALELLARLVQVEAGPSPHELRLDPAWQPLRGEPGFAEIASASQRCLVRAN
jgi:tetratricopeptide (TPR) repeat protein